MATIGNRLDRLEESYKTKAYKALGAAINEFTSDELKALHPAIVNTYAGEELTGEQQAALMKYKKLRVNQMVNSWWRSLSGDQQESMVVLGVLSNAIGE